MEAHEDLLSPLPSPLPDPTGGLKYLFTEQILSLKQACLRRRSVSIYLPSPNPSSAPRSLFPVPQAPEKHRRPGSSKPPPLWQWQFHGGSSRSRGWAAPLGHSDSWGLLTLSLPCCLLGSLDHAAPCPPPRPLSPDPHPVMSKLKKAPARTRAPERQRWRERARCS